MLAGMLAAVLLLAGCAGGAGAGAMAGAAGAGSGAPVAQVTYEPGAGATGVNPAQPARVTVEQGRLDEVTLTNPAGEQVKGAISADGTTWTTGEALGYGKTYTWSGQATGDDGRTVRLEGSFTTVQPDRTIRATINPIDHTTVGIAMPISLKFDAPVRNKAAVQRALEVKTSVPVEGSWAWLSDTQVDWRPKEYWPEHTKVSVEANLYGVNYGDGAYGKTDLTTDFSIGRAQVVKADTRTHQMVVVQDGKTVATYPASYGRPDDPNLNTPNGTYIVMAKHPVEIMDNPKYGYTDVEKKWAVRISNHGEFIHENEENRANIGKRNTSHGCVNLTEADAKKYFDSALIGDPVEVVGSQKTMPPRYAVYDWMLTWEQWQARSAL